MATSEQPAARGQDQPQARDHRLCPACGQYGVEYPVDADAAHCIACGVSFPYVEDCVYCHQPVFLTTSWDQDRQGPAHHQECYPGELQSF